MSRRQGTLVTWEDDRGFGFIEVDGSSERIFVHIKSIAEISTRPRSGDRLSFVVGQGRDGRPAAREVVVAGANPRNRDAERRGRHDLRLGPSVARRLLRLAAALLLFVLVLLAVSLGRAPILLPALYLVLGLVSATTYWWDKRAAERGNWRVMEETLHGLDLVGGISGGLIAQAALPHKTSKQDFAMLSFIILAIHLGAVLLLIGGLWDFPGWPVANDLGSLARNISSL
jgi:uncharacterized membrane protein YsdA (DUF1294 family)/cold shock CspA family protein